MRVPKKEGPVPLYQLKPLSKKNIVRYLIMIRHILQVLRNKEKDGFELDVAFIHFAILAIN